MRFVPAILLGLLCSMGVAHAHSPQPEYISVENLFDAQDERAELRYQIRFYFEITEPPCPIGPTEAFAEKFKKRDDDFRNFISSLQDTALILDANIAVTDGEKNAYKIQSIVDCAAPDASSHNFEIDLKLAQNQLIRIKNAAQIAADKLGLNEDK